MSVSSYTTSSGSISWCGQKRRRQPDVYGEILLLEWNRKRWSWEDLHEIPRCDTCCDQSHYKAGMAESILTTSPPAQSPITGHDVKQLVPPQPHPTSPVEVADCHSPCTFSVCSLAPECPSQINKPWLIQWETIFLLEMILGVHYSWLPTLMVNENSPISIMCRIKESNVQAMFDCQRVSLPPTGNDLCTFLHSCSILFC